MSKPKSFSSSVGLEIWATRYGVSLRVVQRRTNGTLVDNLSIRQLSRIQENLDSNDINAIRRTLDAHR